MFELLKHRHETKAIGREAEVVGAQIAQFIKDDIEPPYPFYRPVPKYARDPVNYAARLAYRALDEAGRQLWPRRPEMPVQYDPATSDAQTASEKHLVHLSFAAVEPPPEPKAAPAKPRRFSRCGGLELASERASLGSVFAARRRSPQGSWRTVRASERFSGQSGFAVSRRSRR